MGIHVHFRNWFALMLIAVVAGVSTSVNGQEKKDSSGRYNLFPITIRAKSSTVKSGLPVWVEVRQKNNSDQIVGFGRERPVTMDQGGISFQVDAWDEKGIRCKEKIFYRKLQHRLTPEDKAQLTPEERAEYEELPLGSGFAFLVKPGETITDQVDVGRLYDLSRPGTYTIQVRLPIQSNKITVTVTRDAIAPQKLEPVPARTSGDPSSTFSYRMSSFEI